ncbi:hypothetical protein ACWCP6_30945 [Streptomyces sp. NPDC002004]
MDGRIPRGVPLAVLVVLGALWWWAVLRLALMPDAGLLEGAVATGGWGLSLLPVHCVPKENDRSGVRGVIGATRAWRRRRSGAGSGPS